MQLVNLPWALPFLKQSFTFDPFTRKMAMRPGLVNKQFNSPIRLYSAQNVQETLDRQSQLLSNGAVGIDFHQLAKPANLSNSAVLRMLEEEEVRGRGQGLKKVTWPPPPPEEEQFVVEEQPPVYAQAPGGLQTAPAPVPVQQRFRPSPSPVPFSPPPTTIILRASPPVSQLSAPVYASQPITATVKGGTRSRGDQKWPPENVKQQSEAENEARIAIAKGPAFRPRKVKKDYSSFFAQHALNSTYPGYKPPPGTQHYIEEGTSNL